MKKIMMATLALAAVGLAAPAFGQDAHVRSIRVLAKDVNAVTKFYEKAFGMFETRRPFDTDQFRETVVNSGKTLAEAKASKTTPIVIATAPKNAAPPAMAALIIQVKDINKSVAAVVAAGGKGGEVKKGVGTIMYVMVADPEGNPIELLTE